MEQQEQVAAFVAAHDLDCPPAYRLLDLAAEVEQSVRRRTVQVVGGDERRHLLLLLHG